MNPRARFYFADDERTEVELDTPRRR